MSSKNKGIKSKLLLRILTGIPILILLFFTTLYIFVPSFRFEEPQPFSGKFIHNPYQKLTDYDWRHIDFRNDSTINTYEYGHGLSQAKYLCLDYSSKRKIDYPFFQNIHFKQHNINCLNNNSSLVIPTNLDKGFKLREIKHLDNYRLMEAISPYGKFLNYWDLALSSGHRINILATTDVNNFKHRVAINSSYKEKEQIIKSLRDGDFYAISYKKENQDLPQLKNLSLSGNTIHISADTTIKELRFIGQNGITKDSLYNVNQGVYIFREDDSYIRIEMNFDDGATIYLNPIVRHQYQYFFDPVLSEMMKEKTWLMRIIYVIVIIFLGKSLLTNKKEINENKGK